MMRRILTIGLVCLAYSSTAWTQPAPTTTITAGSPYSLTFDAASFADGYRAYLDGVKTGADLLAPPQVTGIVLPMPPILTEGAHTVAVAAFNTTGEGLRTPPVTFTVKRPLPGVPQNLTVTVSIAFDAKGTPTITAAQVVQVP